MILWCPTLWIVTALVMDRQPTPVVRLVGVVIIGTCLNAMFCVLHETTHGTVFRQAQLDRWVGFILGVPSLFGFTAFKIAHLHHHRFLSTRHDQDEISNYCRTSHGYTALLYVWLGIGGFLYMAIAPLTALSVASAVDRRRIFYEYALLMSIHATVWWVVITAGRPGWLLWYWFLPVVAGVLENNCIFVAQHLGTDRHGDAIRRSRSVRSNRIVSFLLFNGNYHLEHHLFPGVPWYNLPRLGSLIEPIYQINDAVITTTYRGYLRRVLSEGPGPLPQPKDAPLP